MMLTRIWGFLLLYVGVDGQNMNFTINGDPVYNLPPVTTDLEVNGTHRYPCYISVLVYQYTDKMAVMEGLKVYALTREKSSTTYIGYGVDTTNIRGEACVLTLCRKDAVVFVSSNMEKLFAMDAAEQTADLPPGYTYTVLPRSQEILFAVRSWGTIYGKTGPVYNIGEELPCRFNGLGNYHFKFSYRAIPDKLLTTLPRDDYLLPMSWDYWPPGTVAYQVCFIKIKMLVSSTQTSIRVNSNVLGSNDTYGNFTTGPKANPDSTESHVRAACLEFRCATLDLSNNPMDVHLVGTIDVPNPPANGCTASVAPILANWTISNNGFTLNIRTSNNYGSSVGIYKSNTVESAKSMCYTGRNDIVPDYEMDPNTGFAFQFYCM